MSLTLLEPCYFWNYYYYFNSIKESSHRKAVCSSVNQEIARLDGNQNYIDGFPRVIYFF
jgi:hypothetical protein